MKRLIFLVLVLTGCTSAVGPISDSPAPSDTIISASTMPKVSASQPPDPVSSIKLVHDPGHVTGQLQGPCHVRDGGQLPDPYCTGGAVDPSITEAMICQPNFTTATYRASTYEIRKAKYDVILPAYGMTDFSGEIDHLIPLELGGANDLSNLWPESGKIPNQKDAIENLLHAKVCMGRITLSEAQAEIAQDWLNVKI